MLFVVGLYFQNNNKKKQKMIWPILEKIVNTYSRIWLLILVPGFPINIYIYLLPDGFYRFTSHWSGSKIPEFIRKYCLFINIFFIYIYKVLQFE